jgi:hypothetical protein
MRSLNRGLALVLVLPLVFAGCFGGDDDDPPAVSMARIWPHADQTTWSYDIVLTMMETDTTAVPSDVLPSLEELRADLESGMSGVVASRDTAVYTAMLDGMVTTDTGMVGQHFVGSIEQEGKAARVAEPGRALLDRLALARPELGLAPSTKEFIGGGPVLLGGYAFAAEDTGYYSYGDVDTIHSWTYLERSLRPGTEFSLQLVRPLADDVWLHGRIWSVGDRSFGGRTWRSAVECVYLVDMGLQQVVDENGELLGEGRSLIWGRIWYVQDVGPVAFQERSSFYGGTAYEPWALYPTRLEMVGAPLSMP